MHKREEKSSLTQLPPPTLFQLLRKEQGLRMPSDEDDESAIIFLKRELESSLAKIKSLEKENQELKQEASRLRIQINALKAHEIERKSLLWKKLQNSMENQIADIQKPAFQVEAPESRPAKVKFNPKGDPLESANKKDIPIKLQKPPSRPVDTHKEANGNKLHATPAPPPPPPPPLPSKLLGGSKALRRVPELMEFYRLLMKKDLHKESKTGVVETLHVTDPRNMIGEIENRSSHLMAIKSDVETHEEFINFLSKEVERAAFSDIIEVEPFVRWLDGELSCLVDERAVLKHFPQWPERKADALREAACSYRDIKNLEFEVSSFSDNPKQPLTQSLGKMQSLQDRLERSANNTERLREGSIKKYREFHIPWAWMLDTGILGQLKLSSLTLAKQYMRRVAKELKCSEPPNERNLLLQGVRFAHRVHQFAGGFDAESVDAFEELRKIGMSG